MNTLVCVPIQVDDIELALADANQAKLLGADLVELRIDSYFPGSEGDEEDAFRLEKLRSLIADCPLPVILTCRSAEEGGDYDGDEADRVSMLEKLCVNTDHPPAYLDFELASYRKSANIRQKINLCVDHPKQEREVRTRLILSMHDFDGRPKDLMRRLSDAWSEPAASVVKFAFRARSIRDNLEIFEILKDAPKPTIGLGMGEFGLMSRVLAPKFGGFLTFASLRDEAATAPGQPTIADLLGMYRFRSIGKDTKLYGVIGWPVSQSMSPLIHNAGFEARGVDAVYLPMPVPDSDEALKATSMSMCDDRDYQFGGASLTIPHKTRFTLLEQSSESHLFAHEYVKLASAANTITVAESDYGMPVDVQVFNTDVTALASLIREVGAESSVCIIGAGGVARAAVVAAAAQGLLVSVSNRSSQRATELAQSLDCEIQLVDLGDLTSHSADIYINCTPVGMTDGPDPEGLSIPVHELAGKLPPETVFFDTVYNPIETPMLKAAKSYGFRTIDGVEMFVQASRGSVRALDWREGPGPALRPACARET